MKVNVVGDIAGRFDEFMELLARMPSADLTLAVGDIIDRGKQSRQVVEWFMGEPLSREVVIGNHEVFALDAHFNCAMMPGRHPYWFYNGGEATMESYGWMPIPMAHLTWLETRPAWFRQDGLFVSHAPVYERQS